MSLLSTRHSSIGTAVALTALACGSDPTAPAEGEGVIGEWVQSGGLRRDYVLALPSSYDDAQPTPLVIAFHGFGGSGNGFATFTGLEVSAEVVGFITAFPSGVNGEWAIGDGRTSADRAGVDDVRFVTTLVDHLADSLAIDRSRVYLTGFSQGGFLSLRVACELPGAIAGVAVVGATMIGAQADRCAPGGPLPITFIHGTDDTLVPWDGRASTDLLSVDASVAFWVGLDGCPTSPTTVMEPDTASDGTTVQRHTHAPCSGGSEVVLYEVAGGGHTWPSALQLLPSSLGAVSRDIVARDVIMEFFGRH